MKTFPPCWLRFILASLLIVAVISTATCALLLAMLASAHTPTVAAAGLGVLFLAGAATYPAFAGLVRWSER